MKVEVVEIDRVKKKVEVVFPEEKFAETREGVYEELKKHAKIKGFRPGKVPKSILTTYYKDYIDDEVKKRLLEVSMADAISEAKIEPITEPIVDFIEEDGRYGYTLECEVMPEIEIPVYKGVEVEVDAIEVTDEDVEKRLNSLREMHAQMSIKEPDAVAQKGDFVIIKYQGYMNGKPVKDIITEGYPMELGSPQSMPEFENGVFGMKSGEEKDISVDFPEDYPNKDIAKKTILFKVMIKEIREKKLPEINDEFAKDINFENMEKAREGLREEIKKEKENSRNQFISQRIIETLINGADIPVPERLREKRIEGMMSDALSRFDVNKFSAEDLQQFEKNIRIDFEKKAEERIKADFVLSKIAEKEGIKLEENEVYEKMKKLADETKRSYDDVKSFYEKNGLMGYVEGSIVQEKTVNFLRENAVIKEKV
ncbi:MAG: trigger factor [Proteobacteria bacterium]|nr:trigger factor [Pseudomonadota bacterium]